MISALDVNYNKSITIIKSCGGFASSLGLPRNAEPTSPDAASDDGQLDRYRRFPHAGCRFHGAPTRSRRQERLSRGELRPIRRRHGAPLPSVWFEHLARAAYLPARKRRRPQLKRSFEESWRTESSKPFLRPSESGYATWRMANDLRANPDRRWAAVAHEIGA